MTDEELKRLIDSLSEGPLPFGVLRLADECRRARADNAAMSRYFADACQDSDVLRAARNAGYEDGRRAMTWQECWDVVMSSPCDMVPMDAMPGTVGDLLASITMPATTITSVNVYSSGTTLTTTLTPRYTHDCEHCTFLGRHEEYDLYHCGVSQVGGPTVIARYGDDGPEYMSGILLAPQVPALAEALRRATERGLNVQPAFTAWAGGQP